MRSKLTNRCTDALQPTLRSGFQARLSGSVRWADEGFSVSQGADVGIDSGCDYVIE